MKLLSMLLASQLVVAAADAVPDFDTGPSCRATIGDGVETQQGCKSDETAAHDQLVREWPQFQAADKALCADQTESFDPSYVELLSCLEMMRDARSPPAGVNGK